MAIKQIHRQLSDAVRRISAILLILCVAHSAALAQGSRVITGIVMDTAGRPLSNAHVMVREDTVNARTDETGQFRLQLRKTGATTIVVRRLGYMLEEVTVQIPNTGTVIHNFRLLPGAQSLAETRIVTKQHAFTGLVQDEAGAPVAGADIELHLRGEHRVSDSNGRFEIPITHDGAFVAEVTKLGFWPVQSSLRLDYENGQHATITLKHIPLNVGLSTKQIREMSGLGLRKVVLGEMSTRASFARNEIKFLVTRQDLEPYGGARLPWVICKIREAASRGWACPVQPTCVLVDGYSRTGGGFDGFGADEVEMVELYFPVGKVQSGDWFNQVGIDESEQRARQISNNELGADNAAVLSLSVRGCNKNADTTAVIWTRR